MKTNIRRGRSALPTGVTARHSFAASSGNRKWNPTMLMSAPFRRFYSRRRPRDGQSSVLQTAAFVRGLMRGPGDSKVHDGDADSTKVGNRCQGGRAVLSI